MSKKSKQLLSNLLKGLGTQVEVAKKIGVTQNTVSGYINGKLTPSVPVILRICMLVDDDVMPHHLSPDQDWECVYDFIKWITEDYPEDPH